MEHRALTDPRALLVRDNALATYLGLVGAVNGSVVTKPKGFTLVRGPGPFSFCNFAAGFDSDQGSFEDTVEALVENAEDCFGFYVFVITGDRPADLAERLEDRGFERRHTLVGMHSAVAPSTAPTGIRLVTTQQDRRDVARFMAQQFFWRMPREARDAIAAATAASPHTIWSVGEPAHPEAAVMLVEDGAAVGLFNLCVRQELRRRGLGAAVVRAVQAAAASKGQPVVLQCEPELEPWYRKLGFETVGTVEAFTLSQEDGGDIIA